MEKPTRVEVLKSVEDESVNFVFSGEYTGFVEARYVRRSPKYFAAYLSSQTGCKQGCRMCHLTATKQTESANVDYGMYQQQVRTIFKHYDELCAADPSKKAEIIHFNFMARGEAFDNPDFLKNAKPLFDFMGAESADRNLFPRFLISTIMPKSLIGQSLSKIFPIIHPEIYYSIYSVKEEFRRKWLPKAMPVNEALKMLKEYQENTKKIIKLHWAFIAGENDSEEDIALLCHKVRASGVRVDIAIVRYNPYDTSYGEESSESVIDRNKEILKSLLPFSKIKVITRVGRDVKASCGMFVEPAE